MSLSASGSTPAAVKPTSAAIKRVLLVDDDETLRHTLAEQLELVGGFATFEAAEGVSGFDTARREKLGALLLAVGLPDIWRRRLFARMRWRAMSNAGGRRWSVIRRRGKS